MSINYDPDARPEVPPGMMQEAKLLGWQVIYVVCDEPGVEVGDHEGVSFYAMTPSVPRVGESIFLEDGKQCRVVDILYRVFTTKTPFGRGATVAMTPTVVALFTGKTMPSGG